MLSTGDVVLVGGDVGSGKTTFIRGVSRALGVTQAVTSPTFVIGNRYAGTVPVAHIDLYRLDALELEDPALLDDYLTPDAIAFVEWPERGSLRLALENIVLRIHLSHSGDDRRSIEAEGESSLIDALRNAVP